MNKSDDPNDEIDFEDTEMTEQFDELEDDPELATEYQGYDSDAFNETENLEYEESVDELYPEDDLSRDVYDEPTPQKKKFSGTRFYFFVFLIIGLSGLGAWFYFSEDMAPTGQEPISQRAQNTQTNDLPDAPAQQQEPVGFVRNGSDEQTDTQEITQSQTDTVQQAPAFEDPLTPMPENEPDNKDEGLFAPSEKNQEMKISDQASPSPEPSRNFEEQNTPQQAEPLRPLSEAAQTEPLSNPQIQQELNAVRKDVRSIESELSSFQNEILQRLDDLANQTVQQPSNSKNTQTSLQPQEMQELNEQLDMLSSKFSNFSKRMTQLETRLQDTDSGADFAPADQSKSKQTQSEPAAPKQPATTSKQVKMPANENVSWEIRAIQVGKAVVASSNNRETRNIVVGDSLPGLGTIKAIDYRNGQWIIQGSKDSIQ